jgi:hypothetical protein
MELSRYQAIKDVVATKVQMRLYKTPSIKEDLVKKFEVWFQALAKPDEQDQPTDDQQDAGGADGTA